jgi:hypothetical protein
MKIIREHYESSDAAKLLACSKNDLFFLAFKKEIKLGIVFPEMLKKFGFTCKFYVTSKCEFESWLIESELGSYDNRVVSGASHLQVISAELLEDEGGLYFIGWMKEYWNCDQEYITAYYEHSDYPEEWPTFFFPDFDGTSCCVIKAVPNYDEIIDHENYCFQEELYITGKEVLHLKKTTFCNDDLSKKSIQSDVQKERHAVPRVEVLMALVSLYHQGLNIRKENATQLTELLWKRSSEFWPDRKEPPLKFDTVRDLISEALKRPVF